MICTQIAVSEHTMLMTWLSIMDFELDNGRTNHIRACRRLSWECRQSFHQGVRFFTSGAV